MQSTNNRSRWFVYEDGRLYFSTRTERRVLFVLTLVLLGAGGLVKLGIV